MSKSIHKMTPRELVEFEQDGGEEGLSTDLCILLALRLAEALDVIESCVVQLEEYSEHELVIDDDNNRRYEISALKALTAPVT